MKEEELMITLLLYVANIDGKINPDEVRVMLERFDAATVAEVRRKFNKLNDVEVLQLVEENKNLVSDKDQLIADLRTIVQADAKILPMEEYVLGEIERLLA